MDNCIRLGSFHCATNRSWIQGVHRHHVDPADRAAGPSKPGNLVPCRNQLGNQLAPDDAASPRDEYSHLLVPFFRRSISKIDPLTNSVPTAPRASEVSA